MKKLKLITFAFLISTNLFASEGIKIGDPAMPFKLKTQEGAEFNLTTRKGTWTVLYFFPKAETPGCTKQACAFRDNIKKIRALKADVFGISINTVKDQAAFAKNHNLNFTLLADEKGEVAKLYGPKIPLLSYAKRWTFIIDPDLIIRDISKDVDPILDSERVAKRIEELQKSKN
ncbi:MAG: peroxiredoxin [Bacteriovorax sp.]|nr:peroxiredoxin [Bacteriovorax sp.]